MENAGPNNYAEVEPLATAEQYMTTLHGRGTNAAGG